MRLRSILPLLVVALLLIPLTACGEGTADSQTEGAAVETTAAAVDTTSTTAQGTNDLESYSAQMKDWYAEYEGPLEAGAMALFAIADPLTATEEQVQTLKDFGSLLVDDMAGDLERIQPPADLASAHAAYLGVLKGMGQGLVELAGAVGEKDMSAIAAATDAMGALITEGESSRQVLEEALGFSLGSDDTTETTVGGSGPGTRESPIPIGQEATVGDWKMKVASANLDATEVIVSENEFNDPPQTGSQYVLVTIDATYVGSDSGTFWMDMTYGFVGSKGNTFGSPEGFASPPNPISDAGEAFPGASISGEIVFEVPSDQVVGGTLSMEEFSFDSQKVFFAVE